MSKNNGYEYVKAWFDFAFENPDKITPGHTAMFVWFAELKGRLGDPEKFASPASQTMNAIGLKSYNTYKKIFSDLVNYGFVTMVTESRNQYTACIIALSKFEEAHNKALDRALDLPHQNLTKQEICPIKICESTDSIIKEVYIKEVDNKELNKLDDFKLSELFPSTSKPKGKSSSKQKKESTPATKIFIACRDFWLTEIHPGWMFTAATGGSLKSIIAKLSKQVRLKNKDSTDEDIINSFKVLCHKLPEWYQDKDLQVINSKFNEVITQIIQNRNGKRVTKGESIFRT
jgi:hypothetical protein